MGGGIPAIDPSAINGASVAHPIEAPAQELTTNPPDLKAIENARAEDPAPAPAKSEYMQRAEHGVALTKFLLWVVVCSIGALIAYLSILDAFTSSEVNQVYQLALGEVRESSLSGPSTEKIDAVLNGLNTVKSTGAEPTADVYYRLASVVDAAEKSGRLPSEQQAGLNHCRELTKAFIGGARAEAGKPPDGIDRCIAALGGLRLASEARANDIEKLRLFRDFASDAHAHRQAFRSFWLQAAQLILLNLLLPLLTALLGYIFGSQTSSRT